ncbi:hypothetical protein ACQP2T_60445 [Nonomuraea sp. CA-143628]|uniref:hypothetical protein n=1 Tax=Nonomuraea sp. CA-143628 TaxID=3239997 RepID=UPI003D921ACC
MYLLVERVLAAERRQQPHMLDEREQASGRPRHSAAQQRGVSSRVRREGDPPSARLHDQGTFPLLLIGGRDDVVDLGRLAAQKWAAPPPQNAAGYARPGGLT